MRKPILLFLFISILSSGRAQQPSANEIIAEGIAKMKVKPDLAIFTFILEKQDTMQSQAIKELNRAVGVLEKSLNEIGISNNALKVLDFDVSARYSDIRNYRVYFATNTLLLELGLNNKIVDAIFAQIEKSEIQDLEIDFNSALSHDLERDSRQKLVKIAISDAHAHANLIASSLGISLGEVKKVQKASTLPLSLERQVLKFTPPKITLDNVEKTRSSFDKFEIQDIELEEDITIVYSIPPSKK